MDDLNLSTSSSFLFVQECQLGVSMLALVLSEELAYGVKGKSHDELS
jgi:hypothetical protein